MNTSFFKTTIAALAIIATFNSCKEDEFKLPEETINAIRIKNGAVVEDTLIKDSYQLRAGSSVHDNIFIGTSIDNLESLYENYKLKPYTKYYWKIVVTDGDNSAETDILKFYCVPKFPVEVKNEDEDDWSATVKWKKYEQFGDTRITLVPDSECDYDKAPIAVTKGKSLCRISAGPLQTPKYAIYHQWWDDSKRQYYEPVIYDFTVNADCEFDDTVITAQSTAKGIFLNKSVAVADKQYNVYKIGKIGNRVWMLEDLRGTIDASEWNFYREGDFWSKTLFVPGNGCGIVKNNAGYKSVVYSLRMALYFEGFKELIPEGFHLSTDDDWLDLEANFGMPLEKKNYYDRDYGSIYAPCFYAYAPDYDVISKYPGGYFTDRDMSKDTIIYKGQNVNILNQLISDGEWINPYNGETLSGVGEFNIRPFGFYRLDVQELPIENDDYSTLDFEKCGIAKSEAAAYLTASDDYYGNPIIRLLWAGTNGIGRASIWGQKEYYDFKIANTNRYSDDFVQIRCVKD